MVCDPEMAVFFRVLGKTHGKRFAEYPIKDTWQMSYLPADLYRELFVVCYTGPLPCALANYELIRLIRFVSLISTICQKKFINNFF